MTHGPGRQLEAWRTVDPQSRTMSSAVVWKRGLTAMGHPNPCAEVLSPARMPSEAKSAGDDTTWTPYSLASTWAGSKAWATAERRKTWTSRPIVKANRDGFLTLMSFVYRCREMQSRWEKPHSKYRRMMQPSGVDESGAWPVGKRIPKCKGAGNKSIKGQVARGSERWIDRRAQGGLMRLG